MQFKRVTQIGAVFASVMCYLLLLFLLLDHLVTNLIAKWFYLPKLSARLSESASSARSAIRRSTEPLRDATGHRLFENHPFALATLKIYDQRPVNAEVASTFGEATRDRAALAN